MSFHVAFTTELLFAKLTLERLESLMHCTGVFLEVFGPSKLFPTFVARVCFEFLMNCLDV